MIRKRDKEDLSSDMIFIFNRSLISFIKQELAKKSNQITPNWKSQSMAYTWWTRWTEPLRRYQQTSFVFVIRASLVGDKRIEQNGQKMSSWAGKKNKKNAMENDVHDIKLVFRSSTKINKQSSRMKRIFFYFVEFSKI